MTSKKPAVPNVHSTPLNNEEEKALDFMMMHFNRVVTMDEVSDKAINRAGKTGKAIRDLLGAISLYYRVRNGAKVMKIER